MKHVWVSLALFHVGCGASLPTRYVIERDIDGFAYRRYQKVLDVEFPIEGNAAVGHTAVYMNRKGTEVTTVSVFVSVYKRAASLVSEVRDRLKTLGTYQTSVRKVSGEYVWHLDGGTDEWLLWVSKNRVVKVGMEGTHDVLSSIADQYLDLYPSDLDEYGRAQEGAESGGRSVQQQAQDEAERREDLPSHLREGAPR